MTWTRGRETPNPGSDAALAAGCTCPVLDNAHGRGMPYADGPRFWVSGGCPVHAAGAQARVDELDSLAADVNLAAAKPPEAGP